jgi:hypothetical protein
MASEKTFTAIFEDVLRYVENHTANKALAARFCKMFSDSKTNICRGYNDIKTAVKVNYMKVSDGLLDRHKCAASFMIACLNELRMQDDESLNKEKMAIAVGLVVLQTFIIGDNKNYKNVGIITFLNKNNGFKFPDPICDDKPYVQNWALELYYNRKEDKISVLSLADKLFLIERYNRLLSEGCGEQV